MGDAGGEAEGEAEEELGCDCTEYCCAERTGDGGGDDIPVEITIKKMAHDQRM